MKKILLVIAVLLSTAAVAQNPILNPSFENWTAGSPDDWSTNNIPGSSPIQVNSGAHTGMSAVRGFVIQLTPTIAFPPLLTSLDANGDPHPVSQNFTNLTFYYKLSLNNPAEAFQASVAMSDAQGNGVGGGVVLYGLNDNTSTYVQANVPIGYIPGNIAAGANIVFSISDTTSSGTGLQVGSHFTVDDVALVFGSGFADNSGGNALQKAYPNPAINEINIPFVVKEKAVCTLLVLDMLGREVKTIDLGVLPGGSYKEVLELSSMEAGVYSCSLRASGKVIGTNSFVLGKKD